MRELEHLFEIKEHCFDMCEECAIITNNCATELSEKSEMANCLKLSAYCAEACFQCMKDFQSNSENIINSIKICIKVCQECANECDNHNLETCKICAKICRDCAADFQVFVNYSIENYGLN